MQKGFKEHIQKQLKEGKTGEQLTMGNFEKTRLRVASNKPFAAARAYQRGMTHAASNIGFRPHIKYPPAFAGGYLFVGFCLNSMKVPFVTKESLQTIFEEHPMSFHLLEYP